MALTTLSLVPLTVLLTIAALYFRRRDRPLKDIAGPASPSFLLGNRFQLFNEEEVGDCEFPWIQTYGSALRIAGCLGEDILFLADPKGLQYILHTAGYSFVKLSEVSNIDWLVMGNGLLTVGSDVHKRQRKVMTPAFTLNQLKPLLPAFQTSAAQLSAKWREAVFTSGGGGKDINVSPGLGQLTLDALGTAVFGYKFRALDTGDNILTRALTNMVDSSIDSPKWDIFFKAMWMYLPENLVKSFISHLPTGEYARFKSFRDLTVQEATGLVEKSTDANESQQASGSRPANDIMSVLVRSNLTEDPKRRMTNEEVLAQMSTLILAGQETSASTMTWFLYEIARHPEDQHRLREEILSTLKKKGINTSVDLSYTDYEEMPFMAACIKEALRLHPIVPLIRRAANREDVIPLSTPVYGKSGKLIHQIPIHRGQTVFLSIAGYNRLPSVWGADAHEWNPQRFLRNGLKSDMNVGVYANLLTFSAGTRACIGWRFALLEMQAILVELIENFELTPPQESKVEIRRASALLMMPIVRGRPLHEGVQMPLHITAIEKSKA